jgi:hypothetical protein
VWKPWRVRSLTQMDQRSIMEVFPLLDALNADSSHVCMVMKSAAIPRLYPILQRGFFMPCLIGAAMSTFLKDRMGLSAQYIEERISTIFLNGKPVDNLETAIIEKGSTLALSSAMPGLVGATLRRKGFYASLRSAITYDRKAEGPSVPSIEGEAPRMLPVDGATRADDGQFIEGEAPRALPVEGATRADDKTSEASIEGEAPRALPVEGATRAPLIAGVIRVKLFNLVMADLGPSLLKRGIYIRATDFGHLLADQPSHFYEAVETATVDGRPTEPVSLGKTYLPAAGEWTEVRVCESP